MAESDVRQLVRHHSRELRLIVRGFDRAAVHKHVSSRQSKSIDGFVIHAVKFERILHAARGQLLRQPRAQFCQVSIDLRRVAKRQLLLSTRGSPLAKGYVILRRKPVPARFELSPLRRRVRNQKQGQAQKKTSRQSAMRFECTEPPRG